MKKNNKKVSLSDIKHNISEPDEAIGAQAIKVKRIQAEAFKRLRDGMGLKQSVLEIAQMNNGDLLVGDLDSIIEQVYINNKDLFNLDNLPLIEKVERFLKARYDLRYNVVANRIESRPRGKGAFEQANENSLWRDLQKNYIDVPSTRVISILKSDFVPEYDPFHEYFATLPVWDGEDHIEKLSGYVQVKPQDKKRFRLNFKKMLVRMVACALDESIFNKQCFVLVHEKQNSGKSSFCNWLCPPYLQSYSKVDFTLDKDGKISLCENFIINLDELASLSKADINHLKSVFSLTHIKERLPYGSTAVRIPRRASFVGSTNNLEFLNDETGSVRWLCFEIDGINFAYREECAIDSVYAQAFALWKSGFDFNLTPDDIEQNEKANQQFQQITNERELLLRYVNSEALNDDKSWKQSVDVLEFLLEKTLGRVRLTSNAIGRALKQMGYERKDFTVNGKNRKGYWICLHDPSFSTSTSPTFSIPTPRIVDDPPPF